MSNVLAIAAVTQLLKELLTDALVDGNASQALGADFSVSALPPDRVVSEIPEQQGTLLNLFLHRVTPNGARRNSDLPTRDASGRLLLRPQLALDLHYILTAVAAQELHAEILLGYAMQFFHELALLPREVIRTSLSTPGPEGHHRFDELADQIELVKITPQTLSMDDMSKMWTALQANYRATVAYDVSLVLIERDLPIRPTLPVLSRGGLVDPATGRDPGVALSPSLAQTAPGVTGVEPLDGQRVMRLGRDVVVHGHGFDMGQVGVRFAEPGTGTVLELAPLAPTTPARLRLRLPSGGPLAAEHPLAGTGADPAAWRIGPYAVSIRLTEPTGRETVTNTLPIALAPATAATAAAAGDGVTITMTSQPPIRPGQSVAIILGQRMEQLASPAEATSEVQATFTEVRRGAQLPVRLRVDGIDSPVIDRQAEPPALVTVAIP